MRSRATAAISALALTLLLSSTALAGGWANAVMDTPPDDPGPNQPITIGFTLLQHGVTPVDWGPTQLILTNDASGESVTVDARPQGAAGHWVAEVSVPVEGIWSFEVRHDLEIALTGVDSISIGTVAAPAAVSSASIALQPALLMAGAFLSLMGLATAGVAVLLYRRTRLDRAAA